jgi:hypothetical protein
MRANWAFAGAALVLLVVIGAVTASRTSGASPVQADRLRAIEQSRLRALVDANATTARKLIANDFQLINPGGGDLGREEYLAAVAAGDIDYLVFEPISPIDVRIYGNAAALRYQVRFDLRVGGLRLAHDGWITDLYERRAGDWQVVWEQATAIPNDFGLLIQSLKPKS